ncbi:ABC transporter ATP-binding protein [Halocynthiibacter namhaensis]|uniref:ABC transporter ATP-binding protein n=1 Tax=Halocynthiibacter namhaensis TaxID=1290553 RepID=UPI00057981A6|nr:ABC transporter ATP-binding protein [Halocynthiibacter namhaensis]
MLDIQGVSASYGKVQVLYDLNITAAAGEITCVLGRNGAGKSTLMRVIMGLLPTTSGAINLNDTCVSILPPHDTPKHRIALVPQGRRLFPELTVGENIEVGLMARSFKGKKRLEMREKVLELFPRLRERLKQQAGTLSGGEQQMLATARALAIDPAVLLLDEPGEGLQPSVVEQIQDVIRTMRAQGLAVVLVEQRVDAILSLADKAVFIENGRNLETLTQAELAADPGVIRRNLGV